MTRITNVQKAAIYADLREGESIKHLCVRHNVKPSIIYNWITKSKHSKSDSLFEPVELVAHGQSVFATVRCNNKELILHQAIPLAHLKELLLC